MTVPIIFNQINVQGQETNSTVSIGEVIQDQWSAHAKQNIGNGMLFGFNSIINQLNYNFDPDISDGNMNDPDIAGPTAQGQAL